MPMREKGLKNEVLPEHAALFVRHVLYFYGYNVVSVRNLTTFVKQ